MTRSLLVQQEICNICSHALDVLGLYRAGIEKTGTARQKPSRDERHEIFSRSPSVWTRGRHRASVITVLGMTVQKAHQGQTIGHVRERTKRPVYAPMIVSTQGCGRLAARHHNESLHRAVLSYAKAPVGTVLHSRFSHNRARRIHGTFQYARLRRN
jgi:hypothetical protein